MDTGARRSVGVPQQRQIRQWERIAVLDTLKRQCYTLLYAIGRANTPTGTAYNNTIRAYRPCKATAGAHGLWAHTVERRLLGDGTQVDALALPKPTCDRVEQRLVEGIDDRAHQLRHSRQGVSTQGSL